MRLPDFVIIGAAKAGTTSLHAILNQHPGIFMPKRKEPEFFARDDRFAAGIAAYSRNFADARPDQIVGEASTIYSLSPLFPDTARRMAETLPDAKIIYVLREPVSRAYSYYAQLIKGYQNVTRDLAVHRSFEDFVLPERHALAAPAAKVLSQHNAHLPDVPDLCLAGSDYVHQIETYLQVYPRDQMLFLLFEDFVVDRRAFLRRITDFLGVAPIDDSAVSPDVAARNVADDHFRAVAVEKQVLALRARIPVVWWLRNILPKSRREALKIRLFGARTSVSPAKPEPMLPETRAMLQDRFAAQYPQISALTGLELSAWGLRKPVTD